MTKEELESANAQLAEQKAMYQEDLEQYQEDQQKAAASESRQRLPSFQSKAHSKPPFFSRVRNTLFGRTYKDQFNDEYQKSKAVSNVDEERLKSMIRAIDQKISVNEVKIKEIDALATGGPKSSSKQKGPSSPSP